MNHRLGPIAGALSLGLVVTCAHAGSNQIYTCMDSHGRRLSSDRPIPECLAREQNLLNRDGSVRAVVPPMLSVQEQAQQDQARKLAEQLRADQEEAQRRDRALLRRYPDRQAHDQARKRLLEPVQTALDGTLKRLTQLNSELTQLLAANNASPEVLRQRRASVDASIATQRSFLRARQQEMTRINQTMDEERDRLDPLWSELTAATGAVRAASR